jgi:hypothetical protein
LAEIQLDNPALERNGDRVSAIVCAQLGENIRDVVLDCGFCDRHLVQHFLEGWAPADDILEVSGPLVAGP